MFHLILTTIILNLSIHNSNKIMKNAKTVATWLWKLPWCLAKTSAKTSAAKTSAKTSLKINYFMISLHPVHLPVGYPGPQSFLHRANVPPKARRQWPNGWQSPESKSSLNPVATLGKMGRIFCKWKYAGLAEYAFLDNWDSKPQSEMCMVSAFWLSMQWVNI